jgi:signal transduction histidine kinase
MDALAVDEQVREIERGLQSLDRPELVTTANSASFSSQASSVAARFKGSWIGLIDGNGREIAGTRLTSAAGPMQDEEAEAARNAAGTGRLTVSNPFVTSSDPSSDADRMVAIAIPADGDTDRYSLELVIPVERFAETLREGMLPEGGVAVLVDGKGGVIARAPPAPSGSQQRPGNGPAGASRNENAVLANGKLEGIPLSGAFIRTKLTGWSIGVGVASDVAEAPFRRLLAVLVSAGALLMVAGGLFAWRFAHRVARSTLALAAAAEALGSGREPAAPKAGFREMEHITTRLREAARLLKERAAERDQALDDLRHANTLLEDRVEGRTVDLAEANRRLSDEIEHRRKAEDALGQRRKMEALGQLTAGIAHDFNNLLTPIIGNLEALKDRAGDERGKELSERALNAAEIGAKLTKQLLAFGRRQQLETRVVDINGMVSGVLPLLREAVGPLVELDMHLAEGSCSIVVDQPQMEAALLNLAVNARDAMPNGGHFAIETRWLHVAERHPHVAPGDWALITLTDSGIGMSSDVLPRIFEPFYTTKAPGDGSGLGLSMVYGLIKQLGGEITVASTPGHGTSVTVYLPRATPEPAAKFPSPQDTSSDISGLKILLIDDNPDVLGFMADVLREAGCEVEQARNGSMAVERLRNGVDFDLAIVDFAMPGMNGTATAGALRALGLSAPILLTTGLADAIEPGKWPEEDLLHKPFRRTGLISKVQDVVSRRTL